MSSNKFTKSLTAIITYLLFAVLILGVVYGVLNLLNRAEGMYVVYGDSTLTAENSGVNVNWTDSADGVAFSLENSDGWGAYSVNDCTVKVIPNVNNNDFEFTVNGETAKYSGESDLSAAFIQDYSEYDGNGLAINADGEFTLYLIEYTADYLSSAMPEILSRVYGDGVEIEIAETINVLSYPYFALYVVSPDGSTTITIPFSLYVDEYYINYDLTGAAVSGERVESIAVGGSATLRFEAASGYVLPDEITVTGATLDSWDSSTGTAVISSATGTVTVTVEALKSYSISCNLTNVTASADNALTILENETVSLTFTSNDGYCAPTEITVTNASYTLSSFGNNELHVVIFKPTGDITITVDGVADDTYTLSGVWTFKENLVGDASGGGTYKVNFSSNGTDYTSIIYAVNLGTNMLQIGYGWYDDVFIQGSGWVDDAYRVIDFGSTAQEVSAAFYTFITKYAVEGYAYGISYEVSTGYSFDYSIEVDYPTLAAEGDTVTFSISLTDAEIYNIVICDENSNEIEWTYTDGVYSFVMPSSGVTIYIYLQEAQSYTVTISSTSAGYVDTFSPSIKDNFVAYLASDETLTITMTSAYGYHIYAVMVDNATRDSIDYGAETGENTITFTISNPTDNVLITLLVVEVEHDNGSYEI